MGSNGTWTKPDGAPFTYVSCSSGGAHIWGVNGSPQAPLSGKNPGKINTSRTAATGGAAGKAWEASKSIPGIGAVTTNIEKGLDMADRASSAGLKAIAIGERGAAAFKSGNVGGLKSAAGEAKGLYKSLR